MESLARLDSNSILDEKIFLEIFDQEDEITKARMILSLTDRATELGVKKKFEELLKAYKRVDRETKQRERKKPITMLDKWTNFEGPYDNMLCGAWIAGEDGVYAQNDSQVDAVACYHPILPVERMKNLETGEEQIKIAYKRNGRWDEIIVPKTMVTSASKIVSLSGKGISVTSENAKLLVRFLSDVENMNDSHINVQYSTSKLGWIKDQFIPYDTEIVFDGDQRFRQTYDSISEHGNWKLWQKTAVRSPQDRHETSGRRYSCSTSQPHLHRLRGMVIPSPTVVWISGCTRIMRLISRQAPSPRNSHWSLSKCCMSR